MKMTNLMEDTPGNSCCVHEHGLSFYFETKKHCYLLDFGASKKTVENAEALGIDLKKVDIGILSHGHYDHSGGILPFIRVNYKAKIYMQKKACKGYYNDKGDHYKYIGIAPEIMDLHQVCLLEGNKKVDDELELFTNISGDKYPSKGNRTLMRKSQDTYVKDIFDHEQCAVLHVDGKDILFSGCAHNGVVNVMDTYRKLYDKEPDVMISGFHLNCSDGYEEADYEMFRQIANELKKTKTVFYTGHCTGQAAIDVMKPIMGEQLQVIRCGMEMEI